MAKYGTLATVVGLILWSFVSPSGGAEGPLVPAWLPLNILTLYLIFVARWEFAHGDEEDREGDLLGYDFSQGYTSLERGQEHPRRRPGPLRRWLDQRREQKQNRAREIEAEEERRVDEILARVKDVGMDAITPVERALLNRVAIRYRNRQSHT